MLISAFLRSIKVLFVVFSLLLFQIVFAAVSPEWTGDNGAIWSDGQNWSGGTAPTTSGDTAVFTDAIPPANQPENTSSITIAGLNFDNAAGTFQVTNNNTMTIETDGISNKSGILQQVTNNGNFVLKAGDIDTDVELANNGSITVHDDDDVTINGVISGSGSLSKNTGDGLLILTGNNTYTGDTTISNGNFQIGDGGDIISFDSAQLTLSSVVYFNHSNTFTYKGFIKGPGWLQKEGDGTLILTNDNKYTMLTTINGGTLQLGDKTDAGSVDTDIVNYSHLVFSRSNNYTYEHVISGDGDVTKLRFGNLRFSEDNLYTGVTTISTGILELGIGLGSGNVNGDIVVEADGQLIFNRNNQVIYDHVISGEGIVVIGGTSNSTVIFTKDNLYEKETEIKRGTLQLGNDTERGSVNGDIFNNGNVTFNHSNDIVFTHNIRGSGGVTQVGQNKITLTGNNTYQGITTVSAGQLEFGDGGELSLVSGNMVDNAELIFNHGDDITYAGNITGTGAVEKKGDGTLVLNGINQYEGETGVLAGQLLIGGDQVHSNAQVAGDVVVTNNAVLGGFGKILGNLTLNDQAVLSPGASIGTVTLGGDYFQDESASYFVEINAAGESDLLNVSGVASISGILRVDMSRGFEPYRSYTILTASNIAGEFDQVDVLQKFFAANPRYFDTEILLSPSFSAAAFDMAVQTPNQQAVADYLLETGGTPQIRDDISTMTNDQEFDLLLDQISAATYADQILQLAQTAAWFDDQMASRRRSASACHQSAGTLSASISDNCKLRPPAFWVLPYGSYASISSGEVSGLDTSMGGMMLGADFPVSGETRVGAAFGLDYFSSDSSGHENTHDEGMLYQFGVYADYRVDRLILSSSLAFGVTDSINAARQVNGGDILVSLNGSYRSHIFSEMLGASYDGRGAQVAVRPFAGFLFQQLGFDGFNESGDGDFSLSVQDADYDSIQSRIGVAFELPLSSLTLLGSLSWEHQFEDNIANVCGKITSIDSRDYFNVSSASVGRDFALINAGFVLFDRGEIGIKLLYQGVFSDDYNENGAKIQVDFDLS